ncbi:putative MFS transporter [Ustulina deusta]|nr:putative MFS transporter [Ustulina deusta]
MFRFHFLLLLIFGALVSLTAATSAPIFCKCTCFKNSTLIRLGPQSSCAQCTHAYCLSQDLPICKDAAAKDTDVLSTCIQRDSRKDQIIVWGFILGTAGLLGWAGARRVHELRDARKKRAAAGAARSDSQTDRRPYIPIPGSRG